MSLSSNVVRSMARFRLGCHCLRVETGRYQGTHYTDRVCTRCESGEVDNEHHMIFECAKLSDLRQDRRFRALFHGDQDVRSFMSQPDWLNTARFVHACICCAASSHA